MIINRVGRHPLAGTAAYHDNGRAFGSLSLACSIEMQPTSLQLELRTRARLNQKSLV